MKKLVKVGDTRWYNQDKIDTQDPRPWQFLAIREPLSITVYEYEGEEVVKIQMSTSTKLAIQRAWNNEEA